jgi:hypothetical protein
MGIILEEGVRTIKKKKIQKEINRFLLIRKMAKMKRPRMREAEIQVGYSNNDFER